MSSETGTSTAGPYADALNKKFTALKNLYASTNSVSFWKLGNTFDTLIDYLDTIDNSSANEVATMAIAQCAESIKHIKGGYDGAWFDDFGWWSVACQRAIKRNYFKKTDIDAFKSILDNCWNRFVANAPHVWERRGTSTFDACAPALTGGVWNEYWSGTPAKYPGPKDGNPVNGGLGGIQNTVTNALFLMAAYRFDHNDRPNFDLAKAELKFLTEWLDQPTYPLWWKLNDNAGLIRERVGHFAKKEEANGFLEEWAWAGDQGLMLGNFSDVLLDLAPGLRGPLVRRLTQVIAGIGLRMTDAQHVLQSFTSGDIPSGDYDDYETGSGVFWRNVLHVWKTNNELRPILTGTSFKTIVHSSAAAANNTHVDLPFDDLSNDVAVLVAATAMQA